MCARATARRWRVLYFAGDRAGSDRLEYGGESSEGHPQKSPCDRICSRPEPHAKVRDIDTVCDHDHPGQSLEYDRSGTDKSKRRCKQEEWRGDVCEAGEVRPGSTFLRYRNSQRIFLSFCEYSMASRR